MSGGRLQNERSVHVHRWVKASKWPLTALKQAFFPFFT